MWGTAGCWRKLPDAVGNCRALSGACTGPGIGPVQAFRGVFACMGPVVDLYEHLHSEVVIVQISFVQEIARRTVLVKPLTSEFPHEPFPIDNEPDMGSLCDVAGLVLGRDLKGEFLAIDLG